MASVKIIEQGKEHYGLRTYRVMDDGDDPTQEWAVADSEEQADEAAEEAVRSSLWCFTPGALAAYSALDADEAELSRALAPVLTLCEQANPILELLVGDGLRALVDSEVVEQGRGGILAVDGEEAPGEDVAPEWAGKLAYRI